MAEIKTPLKKYTDAEFLELSKKGNSKDHYIKLHGFVLHLKEDLFNDHPGGPDVVLALGGQDASTDFEDISHSNSARDWASKYIIGVSELAPEGAEMKTTIPTLEELSEGKESDGSVMKVIAAVVVVALAAGAYFVMNQN